MVLSRRGKAILLACALILPAMAAQRRATRPGPAPPKTQPPASTRWPLAAIDVSGNKVFPTEAIVRVTGLKLGDAVNAKDFERAVERLTETGAFESLAFRYEPVDGKLAVTFEVQEVIDLHPVGFERLEIPDAELMQVLAEKVPLFGPQVPATGRMVKRIIEALESYLPSRDRSSRILGRLLPARDGKLMMKFLPADLPPSITFVKFEGSAVLRAEDLQSAFFQVAVGAPYTEARLRELLDYNIRPLFEEKGRLQVRFGPIRVEESKDPAGVVVTVPVQDGEEFRFGEVRFAGNTQFPGKELGRVARLEADEVANFALVNKAVADIERLYKRNGFLHVKAAVERRLDEKKQTVDLLMRVQQGDQYKFRSLEIKGIDINAAAAVRRRWGIQRDQPFDSSYPEVFIQRIIEEAMFDHLAKITHRVTVDEESKMVDVEVAFLPEPVKKPRSIP